MPASLIVPIAGRYTGAYTPPGGTAQATGILTDDGFELSVQPKAQEINQTDAYGMSLLDAIYQGADWRLRYRSKEYSAALMKIFWPFGMGAQDLSPYMGIIGRRWSDIAGSLVLTSTAGTPAAATPATLTAGLCMISPNANLSMNFTSKLREVPIEQVLLPYSDGASHVIWFSCT